MDKANIILIGGAATTGKTTLAKRLAEELQLPWISTDQIRAILQRGSNQDAEPDLFKKPTDGLPDEEVVVWEIRQSELVWRGVVALVNHSYPWSGCVIEGTAILPHLVAQLPASNNKVKAIFLVHHDVFRATSVVRERSESAFIKTKTELQQKSKVAQIELFNNQILADANKYNFVALDAHGADVVSQALKECVV